MCLCWLQETRIGMSVNGIRKHCTDEEVIALAKVLIKDWKRLLGTHTDLHAYYSVSTAVKWLLVQSIHQHGVWFADMISPPKHALMQTLAALIPRNRLRPRMVWTPAKRQLLQTALPRRRRAGQWFHSGYTETTQAHLTWLLIQRAHTLWSEVLVNVRIPAVPACCQVRNDVCVWLCSALEQKYFLRIHKNTLKNNSLLKVTTAL